VYVKVIKILTLAITSYIYIYIYVCDKIVRLVTADFHGKKEKRTSSILSHPFGAGTAYIMHTICTHVVSNGVDKYNI